MAALLLHISIWIIVLPFIAGIICYKKLTKFSKIIFAVVCVGMFPQLLSSLSFSKLLYTVFVYKLLNLSYNLYTVIECVILFYFFYIQLHSKNIKRLAKFLLVSELLIVFFLFLKQNILNAYISNASSIVGVFYVIWIILNVYEVAFAEKNNLSIDKSLRYYYLAIFQYVVISTTILLCDKLRASSSSINNLWVFLSIANIALYVLFAVGFIVNYLYPNTKPYKLSE